jgi:hypothetical protein
MGLRATKFTWVQDLLSAADRMSMPLVYFALNFVIPTRVSCHAAPDTAACAPFGEERRM